MQPKGTDKEKGLLEYLASLILGDNDPKFSLNKFKKDCDILNEKRIDKIELIKRIQDELKLSQEERIVAVDWVSEQRKMFKL